MKGEKEGKWLELSVSVREVSESEVPEHVRANAPHNGGVRSKSATAAYRDNWEATFKKCDNSDLLN